VDPKEIIISGPTFGMYSFLGKIAKSKIVDVPRDDRWNVEVEGILAVTSLKSPGSRQIIFLASPNNPTGITILLP
jgi:histidinol-phosphate/aromatic aminotransferase/cobyric acid decarboxylase-like protein